MIPEVPRVRVTRIEVYRLPSALNAKELYYRNSKRVKNADKVFKKQTLESLNPLLQLTLMPAAGTTKDENIYFHKMKASSGLFPRARPIKTKKMRNLIFNEDKRYLNLAIPARKNSLSFLQEIFHA